MKQTQTQMGDGLTSEEKLEEIRRFISNQIEDARQNALGWKDSPTLHERWDAKKWAFIKIHDFIEKLEAEN